MWLILLSDTVTQCNLGNILTICPDFSSFSTTKLGITAPPSPRQIPQHARGAFSDGNSQEFEMLTGRKPQNFSQWLETNKAMLSQIAQGV
ncbi:hypothetical protein [Photobacterium rosenbergii]|uniref:Uncharacterized protein n=1 Tax=Photobacterium rosenbergii TaxID=294936 RepID=A0ABU3ZDK2_9GAMM|nr:hypothetical protein [Photobacterium rosenbergii]MDV5168187.1 hypothetical protein [Photobacterium rosenbergii]